MNQITRCRTESSVWKRLDNLPSGLQKAYDEIWKGIEDLEDPDRTFVKRALKWVMVANWPFAVPYLVGAVLQDEELEDNESNSGDILNMDDLLYLCGNLLVVDSDNIWRFSHLSVVEYLETVHQWSIQEAHSYAAMTCLSLFINTYGHDLFLPEGDGAVRLFDETNDPRSIKSHFNLYARHNWVLHVHGARATETSSVGTYLKLFLGSPEKSSIQYRRWLKLIESDSTFIPHIVGSEKSRFEVSGFDLAVFTERARSGPPYYRFAIESWATELTPSESPIFAMCRFDFDSILSEWWDDPSIDVCQKNDLGHNLLTVAAISGSVSICKRLIGKGTDVNLTLDNSIFGSSLVAAAYWGHTDVLKCLVEAGADPNIHLNSGEGRDDGLGESLEGFNSESKNHASQGWFSSPLTAAVERNQVEATNYLVNEAKADIHKPLTYNGQGTVLEIAASAGNHGIIKCLVEAGADVNKPPLSPVEGTIIERAFPHGDLKTIRFLVEEAGADIHGLTPESQSNIIQEAVTNKRLDGVKYLVEECHFDVNQASRKDSPLISAVRNQDMDSILYLLSKGADVNQTSRDGRSSPLKVAASIGSIDIVHYLIQQGAEINSALDQRHGSPLVEALRNIHIDCARYLIENGADVNIISFGERGSPLVAAAATGSIELVEMLLEKGADINVISDTDSRYGSVLVAATWASTNSVEMINLLLEAGAAAHLNTPLMHGPGGSVLAGSVARMYASPEPIRCLIEAGAVIDLPLEHGDFGSALSAAACYKGNEEIIRLLIKAGANPNIQLTHGLYGSALASAATSQRTERVKALLEGGADPNMPLQIGLYGSALAVAAARCGSEDVIRLLIDSGADVNMPLSGEHPSALAVAIANEQHANIEILVEAGAQATGRMSPVGEQLPD